MKLVIVLLVFGAVIAKTQSDNGYSRPHGLYMPGYTRIKRVKYSNPPQRFYSRPPASSPNKAVFSYTPPPAYMMENDEPPYPGNPGNLRPQISKKPINEGLGEEDLQNFVKYLSKQDLDKILEYAGHSRESERTRDPYEKKSEYRPTTEEYRNIYNSIQDPEIYSPKPNEDDSKIFSALVKEIDFERKLNSFQEKMPTSEYKNNPASYKVGPSPLFEEFNDYQNANPIRDHSNNQATYATEPTPLSAYHTNHIYNTLLDTQESSRQATYSNIHNNGVTDSKVLTEEMLPRPVNLRDDQDFEVSFTHNVPKFVKAESYKLENFGDLPLMNYNSKLDTLSSYHVPHYTVSASSNKQI